MEIKKCFFTGHRGKYYLWKYNEYDYRCKKLKRILKIQIEKAILQGYNYFIQGMALQGDTWFAEAVLDLKYKYPFIKIEAAIPCKNQDKKWLDKDKIRYRKLLYQMDFVTFCSNNEYNPKLNQMINRDHYMINEGCTLGISICNGQPSGTKKTLEYAINKGIDTIIINPNTFAITIKKQNIKVLECNSSGDKRYSDSFAKVDVFNKNDSIKNHYQSSKILSNNINPIGFKINGVNYDVKYMLAWYKLLWCKYLDQNNDLVKNAMRFDVYNNNSEKVEILNQYIQFGREDILNEKEVHELIQLIKSNLK